MRRSAIAFAALLLVSGFSPASARQSAGWNLQILSPLCAQYQCSGGAQPGPLLLAAPGHLFGTISSGGAHNSGAVFELIKKPSGNKWTFRTIYHFCALLSCKDGSFPQSLGLAVDNAGNLYGTTYQGGTHDSGVAFKLTPNGNGKHWKLDVLYNFCSRNSACTDGGNPIGPLVYQGQSAGLAYDGVSPLYGTAQFSGTNGQGTVFSLEPKPGHDKWRETVLYAFCAKRFGPHCNDGKQPYGLTMDADGNLIGVAAGAAPIGGQAGVLFKLTPVIGERRWTQTVIHTFCSLANCADGTSPSAAPYIDAGGNLFGVTASGGNTQCGGDGCGTLYKIAPDGTETVLYNFCSLANCDDGVSPLGTPVADAGGVLYATTILGGPGKNDFSHVGGGTVFSFDGTSLATLQAFCSAASCTDGQNPRQGVIIDTGGNLYGTTPGGGPQQTGEAFELLHP